MIFTIITDRPSRGYGPGDCNITKDGQALFFVGDRLVATMERVRADEMAAAVLVLSGMEPMGCDKQGNRKYRYQRWFVTTAGEKMK